jgi:hypothetical protein
VLNRGSMQDVTARAKLRPWIWMRRPSRIFLFAFILRVAAMGVLLAHNDLSWGINEHGAIARALVEGRGFCCAFHDAPGPTAWFAPAYPALLACIFLVFGVGTKASAIVAILLNAIFASLTAVVLVRFGREQFYETAGVVAGWAWAAAPPLLFMPWLPWETCLSALVFAFGLMLTLRLSASSSWLQWAGCGATWGFAALANPAILAPLPALAFCVLVRSHRWKGVTFMTMVCMLCILPWTARNFRALGHVVPVRSNFWPELYFGNADFSLHPLGASMFYQREGETVFIGDMRGRALSFLRSNPAAFWRLTEKRALAFWTQPPQQWPYPLLLLLATVGGIVESVRQRKRWLEFSSVLLLYPLLYYITHAFARFRYPIEPLMYALAAYFVCELLRSCEARLAVSLRKR